MKNSGIVHTLIASVIWEMAPIYWNFLANIDSFEIVAHRMLWSMVFAVITIILMRQWQDFLALVKQWRLLPRLFIASALISINWGIYIWAVTRGHVVEASMGYFMNPLVSVLFGIIIFKESLRRLQWLAVTFAAIGVAYLMIKHDQVPYIALILAVTFSSYSAVKKSITAPAVQGMAVETGLLALPAMFFLFYLGSQNQLNFGQELSTDLLLVFGGAYTLIPLLLFASAAKKTSLTILGMVQYLGPTLQLLNGILIFNEPFGSERQVAFAFIWLGLVVFSIDQLRLRRSSKLINPIL